MRYEFEKSLACDGRGLRLQIGFRSHLSELTYLLKLEYLGICSNLFGSFLQEKPVFSWITQKVDKDAVLLDLEEYITISK